jgi:hypothetical protein
VLASPVPLAFVDVSALTEALKAIKLAGEVAGYVGGFPGAGAVLGGIFGGGAGAFLGWEAGSWLQSKVDEIEEVDGRITEPTSPTNGAIRSTNPTSASSLTHCSAWPTMPHGPRR